MCYLAALCEIKIYIYIYISGAPPLFRTTTLLVYLDRFTYHSCSVIGVMTAVTVYVITFL